MILMSRLQGSGKTTFSAKLANYLQTKKNKRVMLVACDVYRPAAIEQLRVLGEQINAKVYTGEDEANPVIKAEKAIKEAKTYGYDVVIVDTAGRLAVDEQMMQEIAAIKQAINPQETLFVVDAMTGEDAVNTAKEFNDRLDFDGVILTKLDGDARGGAALSIRSVVQKPIKFIGTGEKMDALDVFHPSRMADRILGMGDVVSLVERAQEQYDEEEARRISKRIAKNQFDFNDFLSQLAQIKKMGSMKDLMGMIPGMDKALKGVEVSDDAFKPIEAIISSMTPQERSNPSLLNGSRKNRIAKGSGTSIVEVNRFLKQFEQTSFKGLFNFINFINKVTKSSGDMGSAKILGEHEDVVRIMSIHKSKGLEFPVVFLASTGTNFNLKFVLESEIEKVITDDFFTSVFVIRFLPDTEFSVRSNVMNSIFHHLQYK